MRLLFIRHGDPDYEHDSLTEKGVREAGFLAEYIAQLHPGHLYLSPLGRAQKTAEYSINMLEKQGLLVDTPETFEWLQEYPAKIDPTVSEAAREAFATELLPDPERGGYQIRGLWDILPSYYAGHPELFDPAGWREAELIRDSSAVEVYDRIIEGFDGLLARHGYIRDGSIYRTDQGNAETLTFFCHFGVTCVMLSHLMNLSPFSLLQMSASAPTSVTEVVTEERQKGTAVFRMLRFGDTTHLTLGGEEASFSARFCEVYENFEERH